MAPEQALGRLVDGRADLYAIGVILFEMLAGRMPFDRSRSDGDDAAARQGAAAAPRRCRAGVHRGARRRSSRSSRVRWSRHPDAPVRDRAADDRRARRCVPLDSITFGSVVVVLLAAPLAARLRARRDRGRRAAGVGPRSDRSRRACPRTRRAVRRAASTRPLDSSSAIFGQSLACAAVDPGGGGMSLPWAGGRASTSAMGGDAAVAGRPRGDAVGEVATNTRDHEHAHRPRSPTASSGARHEATRGSATAARRALPPGPTWHRRAHRQARSRSGDGRARSRPRDRSPRSPRAAAPARASRSEGPVRTARRSCSSIARPAAGGGLVQRRAEAVDIARRARTARAPAPRVARTRASRRTGRSSSATSRGRGRPRSRRASTCPRSAARMFAGLTSRCTMPARMRGGERAANLDPERAELARPERAGRRAAP